jgi:serine/threonine protein kinase/Tfp pilus assembly protein PilF
MASTDLRPGQSIAHYRIIDKIGQGGMASVYKAMDLKLGRTVALKLIELSEDLDEETRMRFIREARLAAQLNHPGITTIYEINEDQGIGFISMEYIEGWTLKQILATEGPLELRRFFEVSRSICQAIAEAHRHGIVHRDLKLPNIMQTTRGDIKVMDFGIAKTFGEEEAAEKESLTQRGMTLGTVEYMSPEQILGQPLDGRSDVFSSGVLFFELLTGKLPFEGQGQMQTFRAILQAPPRKLRALKPELPERLEQILGKSLQKEPKDRYPSIEAMAAELKALYKQLYAPPQQKGVSLRVALALSALLVAAGLFVGWQLFGKRSGPPGLAVLYFQNETRPDDADRLGRMVTNLLITSLSSDGSLAVVSNQKLYDVLKQLGLSDTSGVGSEEAKKVAQAANASKLVVGSVWQLEDGYRLTAQLIDVDSANVVDSQQAEGKGNLSTVFGLVDQVAGEIRDQLRVGKKPAQGQPQRSLSDATSGSPEAYRAYVEGLDLLNRYNLPDAKAAFARAVKLDPEFTLAYYRLAMTNTWWVRDQEVVDKAIEKMTANLSKLSARDRDLVEAFLPFLRGEQGDFETSLQMYERLDQKYPDEKEILFRLGDVNQRLGKVAEAVPYFERVLQIDRDFLIGYASLLRCYDQSGQMDRALDFARRILAGHEKDPRAQTLLGDVHQIRREHAAAIERYKAAVQLNPTFPDALANMAGVHVLQERYDEAIRLYEQVLKLYQEGASQRYVQLQNLGCVAVHQGRFEEAHRYFELKRQLGEKMNDRSILATSHEDKSLSYFAEGKLDAALEEAERARSYFGEEGGPSFSRAYKGLLHIRRKELEQARAEMAKIGSKPNDQIYAEHLKGWLRIAEGQAAEAIQVLEANEFPSRNHYHPIHLWALAEAYQATGQMDRAEQAYSGIIRGNLLVPIGSTLIVNRVNVIVYPMAYYRLGRVAEERGNRALAHNCYTRFLELWFAAPELPEKTDAKKRLAALLPHT